MSSLKVEIVQIEQIIPHDNADRLEIAQVKGWNVVVGKGRFQVGDNAVYFPVDSVLPEELELKLFPPDSKVKLSKHRIKSIKLRGAMSQGMLVTVNELWQENLPNLGTDVTESLGVVKYEPPEPEFEMGPTRGAKKASKNQVNPNFRKYTDIENIKWYNKVFEDGEVVYISEKLHGTSARYGYVPRHFEGLFAPVRAAIVNWFAKMGFVKNHQFVYGSRKVQLHTGSNQSWYKEDVYSKILQQEDIKNKLMPGECIYGEIVGHSIQKNYTYGCKEGEHRFFAYDVMVDGKWLDYPAFARFCSQRGFEPVPKLYVGPYSKAIELQHRDGDSTIGGQKIREGVVIKSVIDQEAICGRKVLKSISDAYYLEDNTDFH